MKSIIFLFITTMFLVLASCSKNQRSVNTLDGMWGVSGEYTDGELDDEYYWKGRTYRFNRCKQKRMGSCDVEIRFDGQSGDLSYKITAKGDSIYFGYDDSMQGAEGHEIIELTKTKFIISRVTRSGKVWEVHMDKQTGK